MILRARCSRRGFPLGSNRLETDAAVKGQKMSWIDPSISDKWSWVRWAMLLAVVVSVASSGGGYGAARNQWESMDRPLIG